MYRRVVLADPTSSEVKTDCRVTMLLVRRYCSTLLHSDGDNLWCFEALYYRVAFQLPLTGGKGNGVRTGRVNAFFAWLELPVVDGILIGVVHLFLAQASKLAYTC